jgi:hypothetical protein
MEKKTNFPCPWDNAAHTFKFIHYEVGIIQAIVKCPRLSVHKECGRRMIAEWTSASDQCKYELHEVLFSKEFANKEIFLPGEPRRHGHDLFHVLHAKTQRIVSTIWHPPYLENAVEMIPGRTGTKYDIHHGIETELWDELTKDKIPGTEIYYDTFIVLLDHRCKPTSLINPTVPQE